MYKLKMVCCKCGVATGEKECSPELHGKTSHGLCPKCYEIQMSEIDDMILNRKKRTTEVFLLNGYV